MKNPARYPRDTLKQELEALLKEVEELFDCFEFPEERAEVELKSADFHRFSSLYQSWYTRSYRIVARLAPERVDEFASYYLPDPKRKEVTPENFVIQDLLKEWSADVFVRCLQSDLFSRVYDYLRMQREILASIVSGIDTILWDVEGYLYATLQDSELAAAARLKKENLRAAGVIAGVVLEGHLQRIVASHGIPLKTARPTLSRLNEALYGANVYDLATFHKIQYLADIRNLCSHKKNREPTLEQIDDLINGVNMIIKNVL